MRFRPYYSRVMPLWLIPMLYTVASLTAGLILPRLEHAYFAGYTENISVGSALAFFSSVSSGMMALTGIVFAIAFVRSVQRARLFAAAGHHVREQPDTFSYTSGL